MRDIYNVEKSIYCYENSNILINKLNIKELKKLQEYEAKVTAAKLLSLMQKGITGNFDVNHLISIHTYLFEDIYPFAGKIRRENIAKDEFRFAQWEYIEEELEKLMNKLKKEEYLVGTNKEQLAEKLAYYTAELNVLHPFREGNGRAIREFIRQLALKNGYRLNLKKIPPIRILEASKKSIVDTQDLAQIFKECLENKKLKYE